MSKWKMWNYGVAAAMLTLVGASVAASGCADERAPRSFVQPNVIKKADLDGTWWYIQTVTEAPVTNGTAFQGQSSSLMKIKFEVQENYLYAKRAFEQVEGSEDGFWKDPAHYKGQILAAWRITSQFDIIRDYNSTTGEQTNRIIESTERPWNEREFIRVDWSRNEVTDYVGIGLDFFFSDGQPDVQPVSYWVSDPTHPDAMHMERAPADDEIEGFKQGEMNYLDVTNQVVLTPDLLTATYQENGNWNSFTYPKCFFSYEQDDCASQRVKVRHAFAKKGATHDVEPRPWDGKQMELFGVWDVGLRRMVYNRNYGVTNSDLRRHAARFNVWKRSCNDVTDPTTGQVVHPMACENVNGTFWYNANGVWNKSNTDLRIPYKDRQLKQIPYYADGSMPVTLSDGTVDQRYPEFLWPEFQEIVKQWNDAMKVAVKDLLGQDPGQDIFVACHTPVQVGVDPAVCLQGLQPDLNPDGTQKKGADGNPIYRARQGDPRRSRVFWVNEQQNAGPLGYGPPLYDEETGETISGQAYIYGAAVDTYAVRSVDLMLLQHGELTQNDYTTGTNVVDFVTQNWRGKADKPTTYEPKQVSAMTGAMDFKWAQAFSPENGYPALDKSSPGRLKLSLDARENAIYNGYFAQAAKSDGRKDRLLRLVGKPLEKMMMTTENLAVSGVSPKLAWDDLSPMERAMSSPLRQDLIEGQLLKERQKAEMMGVDFATFDDSGLGQRLNVILNNPKYCPNGANSCLLQPMWEQLRQDLKKEIFLGVTLHEVGHNMGCRHNFRASYDAMNYFPDYWKIRFEAINHPDAGQPAGDGKLHPRYVNKAGGAVNQYELDNAVREKQYSSIMDYGAEFNSDLNGLGLYDKAMIKFSYAEMLEVFTDAKGEALPKIGSLHTFQSSYGLPSPIDTTVDGWAAINYTNYPDLFTSGSDGIYKRADVPRSEVQTLTLDPQSGATVIADSQGRPMVPYYFCSDEFVGNLSCNRFDAGPDPYEMATDIISRYQNFYLYNNFKRDRLSFFSSLGYKGRVASRYFDVLRQQLTWYVLLRGDLENSQVTNCELNPPTGGKPCTTTNEFFASENGWGAFTLGVALGFETLGQTLTTPTMGLFWKHTDPSGQAYWKQFRDDLFEDSALPSNIRRVSWIDGKYIDTKWDFDGCGYYWADECQTRIGYMVDKQVALDVLSQSQAYFTGRDTNTDVRQYAIGYFIPFKKQIQEKFASIFAGDTYAIAPTYFNKGGEYVAQQRSWLFDDPAGQNKLDRIDPSMGFTVQLYAGVYGLAAFPSTFDREFIENTKIFVLGNGEATVQDTEIVAKGTSDPAQLIANGGTKEWFVVSDGPSGKTYAAHSVPPQKGDVLDATGTGANDWTTRTVDLRVDMAVRMLQNLQALSNAIVSAQNLPPTDTSRAAKLAAAQNDYNLFRENVEVMRSLHNAFGYGEYKTDAPFYY